MQLERLSNDKTLITFERKADDYYSEAVVALQAIRSYWGSAIAKARSKDFSKTKKQLESGKTNILHAKINTMLGIRDRKNTAELSSIENNEGKESRELELKAEPDQIEVKDEVLMGLAVALNQYSEATPEDVRNYPQFGGSNLGDRYTRIHEGDMASEMSEEIQKYIGERIESPSHTIGFSGA
jgi:hypothetical protein